MRFRQPFLALVLTAAAFAGVAAEQQREIAPLAPPPAGERRLALVIGNSEYKSSPLRNPVNDARAVANALAGTGFAVTLIEDATQATMWRSIRVFGDRLRAAGSVGLFYYAGHGIQVRGRNFLIPVNADLQREDEIEFQAIDANAVLAKMDSAKNGLNLMVLDACRNNPFARSFRSSSQGLAQMEAPSGTLVAFATAPGAIASDGADGRNGVYTKHLLANLPKPGVPVELMFKQVRIAVSRETRDRQIPWESSSLRGNFAFVPADARLTAEDRRVELENALAAERAEQQRHMEQTLQELLARQRAEYEAQARKQGIELPPLQPIVPASVLSAPPKAQAAQVKPPAQVASIAPTAIAAAEEASRMPKVGDYWVYRYLDIISKQRRTVRFEVTGVSKDGLLESGGFVDGSAEIRAASPGLRLVYRDFWELSPYLLSFGTPNKAEKWRLMPEKSPIGCLAAGTQCRYEGRIVGTEKVSTPAGVFDTVKLVVDMNTNGTGGGNWRQITFWYSESTKRVVKSQVRTRSGFTRQGDYDMDLTAYKVN
jgi:uncharacterized caspase-like protein